MNHVFPHTKEEKKNPSLEQSQKWIPGISMKNKIFFCNFQIYIEVQNKPICPATQTSTIISFQCIFHQMANHKYPKEQSLSLLTKK